MIETVEKITNDKLGTSEEREARTAKIAKTNSKLLKEINACQPRLSNKTKKLLHKQLQLLAECSYYYRTDAEKLSRLSHAMIEVVSILHGQNQSFYGEYQPYAVQLPVKDLLDLYANKADMIHRLVGFQ